MDGELTLAFPRLFPSNDLEYYDLLSQQTRHYFRYVLTADDSYYQKAKEVEGYILSMFKPQNFSQDERDNAITNSEIHFENICNQMEEKSSGVRTMPAFSFYAKLNFYLEQAKKDKR